MTKFVIMDGDFPYVIVDNEADAEEMILSCVEECAYDAYLYEIMSRYGLKNDVYFEAMRDEMNHYQYKQYETLLGYLYGMYDDFYAVEVPVI